MTAARLVIRDQPGEPFALVVYPPDGDPIPFSLTPGRALALAESLLAAARRRIEIEGGRDTA